MFAFLSSVAMTADFSSNFAVSGSHLLNADFSLQGSGTASMVGVRGPVRVTSLHLSGRYDRSTARLSLADASLVSDRLRAHVVGGMDLIYDTGGAISATRRRSHCRQDRAPDARHLRAAGFRALAQIKGSYVPATHDILIDRLSTTGGALVLAASGRITLVDKLSPVMDLKGPHRTARHSRHAALLAPRHRRRGARLDRLQHLRRHARSGGVRDPSAGRALDLPAVPDGALLMTFPITNAELSYVQGLTHMTGVNANAKLTETPSARTSCARASARFCCPRAAPSSPISAHQASPGDISAHIDGSMTDLLKLTDQKPLNYATRFGIDPDATDGKVAIDLTVHLPMRKDLSIDDIAIAIKAVSTGFGISLGKNLRLNDGAVTFDVDNTHLHAYGSAGLATSRLAIDWVEDFKSAGAVTTVCRRQGAARPGRPRRARLSRRRLSEGAPSASPAR